MHNTEISRMLGTCPSTLGPVSQPNLTGPAGAIWKAADEATKAPYVEAEAEARRQYGKAMEEYRSQNGLLQLQHHSGPVDYTKQELGDDDVPHDVEPPLEPHEHHLTDGDIYAPMAGAPGPGFVPPPLSHQR